MQKKDKEKVMEEKMKKKGGDGKVKSGRHEEGVAGEERARKLREEDERRKRSRIRRR